jgi:peptide/nickel transport system substrate-binding protein
MSLITRRNLLKIAGGGAIGAATLPALLLSPAARAAIGDTLTIAYNVAPPAWDPDTGPSSVSPGIQSIYRSIFDPYMVQREDLKLAPGVIDQFGWNDDKSSIHLHLRPGVRWQDGKTVTPDDIAWNLQRLTDPTIGSPLQSIFASIKNINVDGDTITFDVTPWRANMLERLAFLACYLVPPHYYREVGKEGFEQKPMGSGPYMFDCASRLFPIIGPAGPPSRMSSSNSPPTRPPASPRSSAAPPTSRSTFLMKSSTV